MTKVLDYKNLAKKLFQLANKTEKKELAGKLLFCIEKYGKISLLPKLIFEIQSLEAKKEGKQILELILPKPVSTQEELKILEAVSRNFQVSPDDLYIVRHYSKRLKAGFIAKKGDYILDASLNQVLKNLKRKLNYDG